MFGERGIGDYMTGGPLYYRVIAWMEIPARYGPWPTDQPLVQQDIVAAAHALGSAGQFPLELTVDWLRLYGYR